MKTLPQIPIILVLFVILGCGSSDDIEFGGNETGAGSFTTTSGGSNVESSGTETAPSTSQSTAPSTSQSTVDPNPIARSTETFGQDGNIWKPVSDETASGGGNLVVLLSAKFTKRFDRCELRKNDGTIAQLACIDDQPWTQIPFSCFSNGNRQTWRADFRCGTAGEVRVTCYEFNQEVVFTVPEAVRGAVCSRFG